MVANAACNENEKQIQENIQDSGECQKQERSPAVSDCPQDAGEVVVQQGERKPQENDHQVGVGIGIDITLHR